ncbi:MAG: RlmF-related methyltransferase, partial [Deltaproteobacteria bacterium]|nr:RlmF-related methyltransferase [Deltaproteobacteria bacterium]
RRKWRNLGKPGHAKSAERTAQRNQRPTLNFGGQARELWCPGGERAFIAQLITESARDPGRCVWFTSLVSKSDSLKSVQHALRQARAQATETIEMKQGQKTSRLVAWTFLSPRERTERLRVQPPATSEAEACANRRSPAAPRRSRSARGPPRG